jgi:hypothetical protein
VTVFIAVNCSELTAAEAEQQDDVQPQRLTRVVSAKQPIVQPDQRGVGDQHPAVAEVRDQRCGEALHRHACHRHGQHHQPRVQGRIAHADLQQQRDQKRHAAAAQPREEVAEQTDAERGNGEQHGREQRIGRRAARSQ